MNPIAAVLRIAFCDPKVATRTSDWNCHPILLNTPTGVIDLETGEVNCHGADLLLTQFTAASPDSGCPRFHGPGGNSKSVFITTLGTVLGDYAATATLDTFLASIMARRAKNDHVRFVKGEDPSAYETAWDRVYITTLFSFEWERTARSID